MTSSEVPTLLSRNPASGEELGRYPATPPDAVAGRVASAVLAAESWAKSPIAERVALVRRWWKILARDAGMFADSIRSEIGKPLPEAEMEVVATLDAMRWIVKNARSTLADRRISPGWQRFALMKAARLRWAPLGVVGIIGTWNYPMFLDAPAIAAALVAGNGIAWKPSELCVGVADRLRSTLAEAGIPDGLVTTLLGGPEVGRALLETPIRKACFTGGSANGRAIASALAARGIPMVCELSGFDAAIVLPSAPRPKTLDALTWAAFVGAGQTCVAVKRVIVVGDARGFALELARRADRLRVGDPRGEVDLGPMISTDARSRFHSTVARAIALGAELLAGGEAIDGPGAFYRPTVLLTDQEPPIRSLEGCFGPIVIVRGVDSADEAVDKANRPDFALSASVWAGSRREARPIAACLKGGMVAINDAVTPSGLVSAPFGGEKASGYGRTRGELGLREFATPRVGHERGPGGYRPQHFPYSSRFGKILTLYRGLFHRPG